MSTHFNSSRVEVGNNNNNTNNNVNIEVNGIQSHMNGHIYNTTICGGDPISQQHSPTVRTAHSDQFIQSNPAIISNNQNAQLDAPRGSSNITIEPPFSTPLGETWSSNSLTTLQLIDLYSRTRINYLDAQRTLYNEGNSSRQLNQELNAIQKQLGTKSDGYYYMLMNAARSNPAVLHELKKRAEKKNDEASQVNIHRQGKEKKDDSVPPSSSALDSRPGSSEKTQAVKSSSSEGSRGLSTQAAGVLRRITSTLERINKKEAGKDELINVLGSCKVPLLKMEAEVIAEIFKTAVFTVDKEVYGSKYDTRYELVVWMFTTFGKSHGMFKIFSEDTKLIKRIANWLRYDLKNKNKEDAKKCFQIIENLKLPTSQLQKSKLDAVISFTKDEPIFSPIIKNILNKAQGKASTNEKDTNTLKAPKPTLPLQASPKASTQAPLPVHPPIQPPELERKSSTGSTTAFSRRPVPTVSAKSTSSLSSEKSKSKSPISEMNDSEHRTDKQNSSSTQITQHSIPVKTGATGANKTMVQQRPIQSNGAFAVNNKEKPAIATNTTTGTKKWSFGSYINNNKRKVSGSEASSGSVAQASGSRDSTDTTSSSFSKGLRSILKKESSKNMRKKSVRFSEILRTVREFESYMKPHVGGEHEKAKDMESSEARTLRKSSNGSNVSVKEDVVKEFTVKPWSTPQPIDFDTVIDFARDDASVARGGTVEIEALIDSNVPELIHGRTQVGASPHEPHGLIVEANGSNNETGTKGHLSNVENQEEEEDDDYVIEDFSSASSSVSQRSDTPESFEPFDQSSTFTAGTKENSNLDQDVLDILEDDDDLLDNYTGNEQDEREDATEDHEKENKEKITNGSYKESSDHDFEMMTEESFNSKEPIQNAEAPSNEDSTESETKKDTMIESEVPQIQNTTDESSSDAANGANNEIDKGNDVVAGGTVTGMTAPENISQTLNKRSSPERETNGNYYVPGAITLDALLSRTHPSTKRKLVVEPVSAQVPTSNVAHGAVAIPKEPSATDEFKKQPDDANNESFEQNNLTDLDPPEELESMKASSKKNEDLSNGDLINPPEENGIEGVSQNVSDVEAVETAEAAELVELAIHNDRKEENSESNGNVEDESVPENTKDDSKKSPQSPRDRSSSPEVLENFNRDYYDSSSPVEPKVFKIKGAATAHKRPSPSPPKEESVLSVKRPVNFEEKGNWNKLTTNQKQIKTQTSFSSPDKEVDVSISKENLPLYQSKNNNRNEVELIPKKSTTSPVPDDELFSKFYYTPRNESHHHSPPQSRLDSLYDRAALSSSSSSAPYPRGSSGASRASVTSAVGQARTSHDVASLLNLRASDIRSFVRNHPPDDLSKYTVRCKKFPKCSYKNNCFFIHPSQDLSRHHDVYRQYRG